MALIVEDGTGKADAESYASVAQADAIAADFGVSSSWSSLADSAKESALRAATLWIDSQAARFPGVRSHESQALEWPRAGTVYSGRTIYSDQLPAALVRACALAAVEHAKAGAAFVAGDTVTSESVSLGSGALAKSVTFASPKTTSFRPQAAILCLSPLLKALTLERS